MADALMKTIGMNLSSITTNENFALAAIQIADYFSDHFGDQFEAPAAPNVTIQKAIKQCGMACSLHKQAITQLAVMQALYAAAL